MKANATPLGFILSCLLVVRPYTDGRHLMYRFNLWNPLTYVVILVFAIVGLVETVFTRYTVRDVWEELVNLCTGRHIPDSYRRARVRDLTVTGEGQQ